MPLVNSYALLRSKYCQLMLAAQGSTEHTYTNDTYSPYSQTQTAKLSISLALTLFPLFPDSYI